MGLKAAVAVVAVAEVERLAGDDDHSAPIESFHGETPQAHDLQFNLSGHPQLMAFVLTKSVALTLELLDFGR